MERHIFSRRTLLEKSLKLAVGLGALAVLPDLAVACAPASLPPKPDIRRAEGTWSREEIERAGKSMTLDERFKYITRVGKLIHDNQSDANAISSWSHFFSGEPIVIESVAIKDKIADQPIPAASIIDQNHPAVKVTLKGLNGTPDLDVIGGSSVRLSKIQLNTDAMEGRSDFLLKLYLAKEAYSIVAFDLATEVLLPEVYKGYELPSDALLTKTLKAAAIVRDLPDGTPLRWIADFWGHFAILPDYLLALDLGTLTDRDQEELFVFATSSQFFKDMGIVTKTNNGTYDWVNDYQQVIQAWYKVAWVGYNSLMELKPSKSN